MKYCKNCSVNTRPRSDFDNNGICSSCNYYKHFTKNFSSDRYQVINQILKKNIRKIKSDLIASWGKWRKR